ncbi:unnamed protein product [Malus baccata var. baccata]
MEKERRRQYNGIELIASENFVCRAVMETLGSHLTSKYSEGFPGARYYTGNQHIDQIELLCCERALAAFGLDSEKWVYTGLLLPNDQFMGLDSPSGGHMSHGYYTPSGKKVSGSSIFFDSLPYKVNPQTGSYPREWDYARFRHIADKCGASWGPRGGIIFSRKGPKLRKQGKHHTNGDEQGGPHNNHIAALAIALKQAATPEYKAYMQQVKKNAQALANALLRRKCRLVAGGTDNHLLLWDLTALGLTDVPHILNKTAIFGDNGAFSPGGVRIGTPAMSTRGCVESDFETIADFLLRAAQITVSIQREYGKFQKDFIKDLRNRIETFASQFEMPGYD